jgi:calmodulin
LDVLKKELSSAFRIVRDEETNRIDAEQFADLFWHLREAYDRENAERERQVIEKYGLDIDSEDAQNVKDELLSLHALLASASDNKEPRRLDIVDVRGIVGIFIESGLLPPGGDQAAITHKWFDELSGKDEIDFQDLRQLVEKIREEAWRKERQHVMRMFAEFDKNNTGILSMAQVSGFFKSLGLVPRTKSDQEELRRLLEEVDIDDNGHLDFDEFARLVQKVTIKLRSAQRRRENEVAKQLDFTQQQFCELREAFFTLDANENHLLEINECRKALTLMRKDMSGPELNALFGTLDKDKDGHIDFEEFLFFVKAVEQPGLDWRSFLQERFFARNERRMSDFGAAPEIRNILEKLHDGIE